MCFDTMPASKGRILGEMLVATRKVERASLHCLAPPAIHPDISRRRTIDTYPSPVGRIRRGPQDITGAACFRSGSGSPRATRQVKSDRLARFHHKGVGAVTVRSLHG